VNQPELEPMPVTLDVRIADEGPTILKLAPTTEELLSGPLFQVAGMFEIDEPGWADKHDEYLAETYL
jgi:hypothetical protein